MPDDSIDELEIFETVGFLSALLEIDDPISIRRGERFGELDFDKFLNVDMDIVQEAFKRLDQSNLSERQKDLFEFYRRVKEAHKMLMGGMAWEVFDNPRARTELGREDPKKMIRVDFGPVNEGDPPAMGSWTLDQLREALVEEEDENNKSLNEHLIKMLELDSITKDEILVCYYDSLNWRRHGIPFDRVLFISRR